MLVRVTIFVANTDMIKHDKKRLIDKWITIANLCRKPIKSYKKNIIISQKYKTFWKGQMGCEGNTKDKSNNSFC